MQPMPNAHAWNKLLKVSIALPCSGYDLVPDIANSDRTFDPLASAPTNQRHGCPALEFGFKVIGLLFRAAVSVSLHKRRQSR